MARRLTNLFCYGEHFLNTLFGGRGGGGGQVLRLERFLFHDLLIVLLDHKISD